MNAYRAVLWPSHRHDLAMDLDMVLFVVRSMVGTYEPTQEEIDAWEPTQEEIDAWMCGGDE